MIEREIETSKGKKFKRAYNEDVDEEMDTNQPHHNQDQEYDDIIANNKVYSIDEIETKQLSNRSILANKEITKDDMIKKASFKSVNEFDIDGYEGSDKGFNNIKDTTSEGSIEGSEPKSSMSLKANAFTPKNKIVSKKSIDEFDIEGSNDKSETEKPKGNF